MAFSPGTRLGPYEVTAQIGAGGMGEVYRARDTNLGRDVAIKVVPNTFAQDVERLGRFEREARTLASLNHPNIAQIYGLERADPSTGSGHLGIRALVMELVEGPTLEDRIARGPIPIEEALPVAKQIAEALEAAHEQGIIHRDLKPANVKVRPDGTVKVLDFGLAKLAGAPEGGHDTADRSVRLQPDLSQSPTITSPALMTGVGMLLGTAAYMSPEQAHGKSADRRADVFSFGAVLYEMLTGRRAFTGESVSDTLASVLKIEPDWSAVPADVPDAVRRVLRRCLTKDRRLRLQAIGEARIVFENPVEQAVRVSAVRSWQWIAAAALFAAITGVALWGWLRTTPPESRPSQHFTWTLPPAQLAQPVVAISPDGSLVAYPTLRGVYLRAMDEPEPRLIPNTQSAVGPISFSPDGQSIAFVTSLGGSGFLRRVSLADGRPTVVDLASVRGADSVARANVPIHWGLDDRIYFAGSNGLMRVAARGAGQPQVLLPASRGLLFPVHLLRGGKVLLTLVRGAEPDGFTIEALDLETGDKSAVIRELVGSATSGGVAYAADPSSTRGHIMYGTPGSLYAVPFDEESLRPSGPTVSIPAVSLPMSVSDQGTLAYVQGTEAEGGSRRLVWVNTQGVGEAVPGAPRAYSPPLRLSPRGDTLAASIDTELWTVDLLGVALLVRRAVGRACARSAS